MGQMMLPVMPEGVTRRHCVECGGAFEPYKRADGYQKYCSHACRQRAWVEEKTGKRSAKAAAILERLKAGPADTLELVRVGGVRFGARIHELREEGYQIKTESLGDHAVYTLDGLKLEA